MATTALILQLIASLKVFGQTYILTSGGPFNTTRVALHYMYETAFTQSDAVVSLNVRTPAGAKTITADWLVACDGGRSIIRDALGIVLEGDTYADKWLIVDMVGHHSDFIHTRTYCDPLRPAIRLPGPQTTLRYEFMLKPEDDEKAVLEIGRAHV